MLLALLVDCSRAVAASRSRKEKVALLAHLLRQVGPDESGVAISYLSGGPLQRRLGIPWVDLAEDWPAASWPRLSLQEVDRALGEIEELSGLGSVLARRQRLRALLAAATPEEQSYLKTLVGGGLRQGALQGVMTEAVAAAAGVPAANIRRAAMLAGDLVGASRGALAHGEAGLAGFGVHVGSPLLPMLASSAVSIELALERARPAAVEWKLDGVRIQVHRDRGLVRVFTRTLESIEDRLPEVVELARQLPGECFILDGEVLSLRADGRPRPFQQTAGRVSFRGDPETLRGKVPLSPYFFDLLHLDGQDLIDLPTSERIRLAAELLPPEATVTRMLDPDLGSAQAFLRETLARGHEGVMVKALDAPYRAGRRGDGWIKVKPRHTLDLVVLAADWGHGRRQGLLSNLHLGARDPTGGFVMLGKTFKGLTDEMLRWQTTALLALETGRDGVTVSVSPQLVVEVAIDGLQVSRRYSGGIALRFARVVRFRPDKAARDAETIEAVRALLPA